MRPTATQYDEDLELSAYVWRWYSQFATEAERHLAARLPPENRQSRLSPEQHLKSFKDAWESLNQKFLERERWAEPSTYKQLRHKNPKSLPSLPELTRLRSELESISELIEEPLQFRSRVALRILVRHRDAVTVARCPQCSRILASPTAQQCLWCGHDWHPKDSIS